MEIICDQLINKKEDEKERKVPLSSDCRSDLREMRMIPSNTQFATYITTTKFVITCEIWLLTQR